MKAYGVKRQDQGCCPGHDKYPKDRYKTTSTDARKRRQKPRKSRARQENKNLANTPGDGFGDK